MPYNRGMNLDPAVCYRAMLARDERHDGRFFICVTTTGIFCRPVCPARPPKFENCQFLPSAAAASEAGFRPCLRCKPESSPNTISWTGTAATVSRGLRLIEDGALDDRDVQSLAMRLGVGQRHLRRLFHKHVGASPIAVAQTRRVLFAKQLIHHTDLPMTDVALASGFRSVRRFNETFQRLYDRPPSQLRRQQASSPRDTSKISLLLPYRAPYDWDAMLIFLSARAIHGVETVRNGRYCRTIQIGKTVGTMCVQNVPERSSLRVTVTIPCIQDLSAIIARTRRLFDLSADPAAISLVLSQDELLARLVAARPGLRVPGAWDGFEIAVRAILGQQISVAAATKLADRLVAKLGLPIPDAQRRPGLSNTFPTPDRFDFDLILAIGMPRKRAEAIVGLADAAVKNPTLFDPKASLEDAIDEFRSMKGIGQWTAQYVAMRVLRESDAFLAGDVALQRIIGVDGNRPNDRELLVRAESWRPWRAYATLYLWMSESQPVKIENGDKFNAIET